MADIYSPALVARNLRRVSAAKELSPETLAVDARMGRTYVSRLEGSLENPTVTVLERLASALNAEIVEFFDAVKGARGPIKLMPSGRRKRA